MSQLARAYGLSDVNQTRTLYDEWASTYDSEMAEDTQDYVGPALASTYVLKCLDATNIDENVEILDAGCGTGLVGVQLAKRGAKKIDGVDLSPGMLDIARGLGVYRHLNTADLSKPLTIGDKSYDVVACVGTFTQGHVGPDAFSEFVRVVKRGGAIVSTVLGAIWESGGYKAKIESLQKEGKVKVVSAELEEYRRGVGVKAMMVVLQVLV